MVNFLINPNDLRYFFLTGDSTDLIKIEKHFNKIPQYQCLPTYPGIPTPDVYIDKFKSSGGTYVYYGAAGLWRNVQTFCNTHNIGISEIPTDFYRTDDKTTLEEFSKIAESYNKKFNLHDYQIKACWLITRYKNSISELCTRSGKTAMMACILQYLMEHRSIKKPMIVVPSIHLVKQGVKDFSEYTDFFEAGEVWAGSDIKGYENCIIGTFQSIVLRCDPRSKKYNPAFFDGVDCVVIDEVHKANCKSIKTILTSDFMKNVKYKFGVTGTLPKEETIESYGLQSLLGPKIQEIGSRMLIEEGFLADPIIKQFRIKYDPASLQDITIKTAEYLLSIYVKEKGKDKVLLPMDQREFTMVHKKRLPTALVEGKKLYEPNEYVEQLKTMLNKSSRTLNMEQMCAMFSANRLELMDQLIGNLHKNVIVFAHNTEYINYLEAHFKAQFPDRQVYKIIGATNLKKRQAVIDKMLESDDCILIGSYGVTSTGLTFKNVDYGIFAQSFKADTITRQSLGRLMLRTEDKSEFYLYDIIDEFPTKKLHNQALEKIKIYKREGHRHEIVKINAIYRALDAQAYK